MDSQQHQHQHQALPELYPNHLLAGSHHHSSHQTSSAIASSHPPPGSPSPMTGQYKTVRILPCLCCGNIRLGFWPFFCNLHQLRVGGLLSLWQNSLSFFVKILEVFLSKSLSFCQNPRVFWFLLLMVHKNTLERYAF